MVDKTVGKYLEKLQESGAFILGYMASIRLLVIIITRLIIAFKEKQLDSNLSKSLKEITNIDFKVYTLKNDEPNAFVFHIFKKNLYMTTGLYKMLNERERVAVLLHESNHYINKDVLNQIASIDGSLWILAGLFAAIENEAMKKNFAPIFAITGVLAVIAMFLLNKKIWLKQGRTAETKADVGVVKYGYTKDLISALKKLEEYVEGQLKEAEKKNPDIRKQYEEMKKSDVHPEVKDRIKKLLEEKELFEAIVKTNLNKAKKIILSAFSDKLGKLNASI